MQEAFTRDPHGGDLYVFRDKSGKLIKMLCGRAGPKLLAHVLFAKYGLHLPLHR